MQRLPLCSCLSLVNLPGKRSTVSGQNTADYLSGLVLNEVLRSLIGLTSDRHLLFPQSVTYRLVPSTLGGHILAVLNVVRLSTHSLSCRLLVCMRNQSNSYY